MWPTSVYYYGQETPLPESRPLRAGPLTLSYEEGDLRYVKLADKEIIRRIYVAIRDRNWGTIPPSFSNLEIKAGDESFRITYDVENKLGDIDFSWHGAISGEGNGTISFTMDGVARSTFWRNRIGFCVLHPASCAGAKSVIRHVDGKIEQASLPTWISPDQPVLHFTDMQSFAHEVTPGLWAEVRFSGDLFETEDQRNWTDASFKTFCTPLRLPLPVQVEKGTRISQSITVSIRGEREGEARISLSTRTRENPSLILSVGSAPRARMPSIGLGVASHSQSLNSLEIERLKKLGLDHLRVDLPLRDPGYVETLRRADRDAKALGVSLHVALLIPEEADGEIARLASELDRIRPRISTWLVYPEKENLKGNSPTEQVLRLAREHLAGYDPTASFAAGTNTDLIFLQRTPPPLPSLDAVTFAVSPQAHAFDNASIVETLEVQAAAVSTVRRMAGSLPILVSPVTLKPRFNPYATGPVPETAPGELPPPVDPRQMSLLGGGWTLGSLKYLAESGVDSVTFYETTGWRGVMETERPSVPDAFHSLPGSVFPIYHILMGAGEFAGGSVIPSVSSNPLKLNGLAIQKGQHTRVLVANLSGDHIRAGVNNLSPRVNVRQIDERNVLESMQHPELFHERPGTVFDTRSGALELELMPYALGFVDSL